MERALAFAGNPLHRALDGGMAVAARGPENVTHQAMRDAHAHQHRFIVVFKIAAHR